MCVFVLKCKCRYDFDDLTLIKQTLIICFCVHLAVCVFDAGKGHKERDKERERFGLTGLAGEQTFAPGCYATF